MEAYEVLKLPRNASQTDIQRAYRRAAQIHHPDKTGSPDAAVFRKIKSAYETLMDPVLRAKLDEDLAQTPDGCIAEEVDLDDLPFDAPSGRWQYECRCGCKTFITEEELEDGVQLFPCSQCSSVIHLLYEAADEA